jgi:ferritin heavy chain
VALHGFSKYFRKSSKEERDHAEKLIKYMADRGGRVFYCDVKRPTNDEWGTGVMALQTALGLEKDVNQSLLNLHGVGSLHTDPHLCDFLETHYLTEQVDSIKYLSDLVTRSKRAGEGLGEHLIDKELDEHYKDY